MESLYADMNQYQGLARMCATYENQRSTGINPFSLPLSSPHVHTRFITKEARKMQGLMEKCKSDVADLESDMERSRRRETNQKIGRNICLLVHQMVVEKLSSNNKHQARKTKTWKSDANKHATEVVKAASKIGKLERRLDGAMAHASRVEEVLTEMGLALEEEKEKAVNAERDRLIGIRSLRDRCKHETKEMEDEIVVLRGIIREQENQIDKMQTFADESEQHVVKLQRTIAMFEKEEMMSSISQRLSNVLYEIGKAVLVRPDVGESVPEKIRDIRELVSDLVVEVVRRRANSDKAAKRIFELEEERSMWSFDKAKHDAEIESYTRVLFQASGEIARLRNGQPVPQMPAESSSQRARPDPFRRHIQVDVGMYPSEE